MAEEHVLIPKRQYERLRQKIYSSPPLKKKNTGYEEEGNGKEDPLSEIGEKKREDDQNAEEELPAKKSSASERDVHENEEKELPAKKSSSQWRDVLKNKKDLKPPGVLADKNCKRDTRINDIYKKWIKL